MSTSCSCDKDQNQQNGVYKLITSIKKKEASYIMFNEDHKYMMVTAGDSVDSGDLQKNDNKFIFYVEIFNVMSSTSQLGAQNNSFGSSSTADHLSSSNNNQLQQLCAILCPANNKRLCESTSEDVLTLQSKDDEEVMRRGYISLDDVGFFKLRRAPNVDAFVLESIHCCNCYVGRSRQSNCIKLVRTDSTDPTINVSLQPVDVDEVDGCCGTWQNNGNTANVVVYVEPVALVRETGTNSVEDSSPRKQCDDCGRQLTSVDFVIELEIRPPEIPDNVVAAAAAARAVANLFEPCSSVDFDVRLHRVLLT